MYPGAQMKWCILSLIVIAACYSNPSDPITEIKGTWGGDNAGLITTDTSAHIHIGCTLGDTKSPIRPDARGNFDVTGTYNVDAYPVDRGIIHPARFTGTVAGDRLTLTVTLTDDGRRLGPVKLERGKEPKMGPCPICRTPGDRRGARGNVSGAPFAGAGPSSSD